MGVAGIICTLVGGAGLGAAVTLNALCASLFYDADFQ
jgi:hypothetical protein